MNQQAVGRCSRQFTCARFLAASCVLYACLGVAPALAVTPRPAGVVGEVVSGNGGEEIRFFDAAVWQTVDVAQELVPGDLLRTGPHGLLAILFRDETQVRLHRNSIMRVERIGPRASSVGSLLRLDVGSIWSRARPVADGLQIETPAATAAIRGTDWALSVAPDGTSTLVVLSGRVEFFNAFGSVSVERGEQAFARVGQVPIKRFLIDPRDQPRWALYLDVEWVQMLSLTGDRLVDLQAEHDGQDRAAVEGSEDVPALLRAAEIAYDLGDLAEADRLAHLALPAANAEQSARIGLLQALVALQQRRHDEAEARLDEASGRLAGRPAMVARLARVALAVETRQPDEAERLIDETQSAFPDRAEPALARAWLLSFAGEHEAALDVTIRTREAFPGDAAAPFLSGHLHQLLGQTERSKQALEAALAADPGYFLAWNWLGLHYHADAPDSVRARASYESALAINPNYANAWNNLGLYHLDLGDYAAAESALQTAIGVGPDRALPRASYAAFLSVTDRTREASRVLDEASALEPSDPAVLFGRGYLALQQGRTEDAIEWMLKAIVVDPAFPGANTALAIASYQAGRVDDAQRELATARRLDPDDPVAPLIGSVIAQDQAEAGEAIQLAQDAFDKYEASTSFAVENLASTRSGLLNLGSAYTNVGLTDWGAYYGELSASPYLANSYFFLADTYPSFAARNGAITQGLLLDPTAVSAPTRYFEFVRQPRIDPTIGGSVGDADGGFVGSASASVQGFSRLGSALAYNVGASRLEDSGYRKNADVTSTSVYGDFGFRADEANSFLVRTLFDKTDSGVPGPADMAQKDDENDSLLGSVSLGYQHRFDFDNRIIVQATYQHLESKYHNNNAFGNDLSATDFSLVNAFGVDQTRAFYADGLYDATDFFGLPENLPFYISGPLGGLFGPEILSTLSSEIEDPSTIDSISQVSDAALLQFRHLFQVGPTSLTYGAEWMPEFNDTNLRQNGQLLGFGVITDPTGGIGEFPFLAPQSRSHSSDNDRQVGQGYAQASWRATPELTFEGGGFVRHYENGVDNSSKHVDPRIGAAWRLNPDHWLRLAYQQDQIMGFMSGSLAPVSTVGLVVPDPFLAASGGFTPMSSGSRSADLALRWDAQWSQHAFSFVQANYQTFDDTQVFLPFSFASGIALPRGERTALSAGSNVWFLERFGAFGIITVQDSEAHEHGSGRSDPNMPLLPGYIGRLGVTWVHPWQIRATLTQSFVGERASDSNPRDDLDSYRTTDVSVSWQPFDKHVLAQIALLNILDDDYEVAAAFPAPGRTVLFSLDYRF